MKGLKSPYKTRYYPKSVQAEDGRIFVIGHNGSDDWYGKMDQCITMDCFELSKE